MSLTLVVGNLNMTKTKQGTTLGSLWKGISYGMPMIRSKIFDMLMVGTPKQWVAIVVFQGKTFLKASLISIVVMGNWWKGQV